MAGLSRSRWVWLLVLVPLLLSATLVLAHPGGLDAYGGHNDHKHGGYHFHRGPLAGQAFATKEEALAALAAAERGAEPSQAKVIEKSAEDRLDALIRVLVRKGIITEKELKAEQKN